MRLRLFLFLAVLMVTMVLGLMIILILTGTMTAGLNESESLIQNELSHAHRNISDQYGQLSVQAVELSKELSLSIENRLRDRGIAVTDIQNHPEILEDLIAQEYDRTLFALKRAKSSGVFFILDATINAKLENAKDSKAGIYIRNMEPNILSANTPTILLLRGFPSIGRQNAIHLHSEWRMEFDVSQAAYYSYPVTYARERTLPLSRLYYWSPAAKLPGTSDEVMICSVPLLDRKGNVFGVCGFEVSSMLFKLSQMPQNSLYQRIFCVFSPMVGNVMKTEGALFSGGYSVRNVLSGDQSLTIEKGSQSYWWYLDENRRGFAGYHRPVELYPQGSAFEGDKWAVALLIPEEDFRQCISNYNTNLIMMLLGLMLFGILMSLFLTKRYIRPIVMGLELIKTNELSEAPKTKVAEIDNLIAYLSAQNDTAHQKNGKEAVSPMMQEFLQNLQTLTPAERAVFNLYVQQYTAKEIAGELYLSINTIKTHTKRIYAKLNVSSREELRVFIQMLREAGKDLSK